MLEIIGYSALFIGVLVFGIYSLYDSYKWAKAQDLKAAEFEKFCSELKVGGYYRAKPLILPLDPFKHYDDKVVIICDIKDNQYNEKWVKFKNNVEKYQTMPICNFYEYYEKMDR